MSFSQISLPVIYANDFLIYFLGALREIMWLYLVLISEFPLDIGATVFAGVDGLRAARLQVPMQ